MRRFLPLLIALAAAGCSDRQRANPLDPRNPNTGGAPSGFAALANDGSVSLTWTGAATVPIEGFRLERRVGAAADFTPLAELPANSGSYFDGGLVDGVDAAYRLRFILADGTVGPAAEDIATPGPARPWVADAGGALVRVAPDGRRVAERLTDSFQEPVAVDVDPASGRVFVCDFAAGQVFDVSDPPFVGTVGDFVQPVAVAVNRANGFLWVCDQAAGTLSGFPAGVTTNPAIAVPNLATPLSVGVDPVDGSVWVCERTGDRVRHIGAGGSALGSARVLEPSRVAIDSVTRRVWVTSEQNHQLTLLTAGGTPIDSVTTLAGPLGLAIDPRAGRIWVADADGDAVVAYDRALTPLFRVRLATPREIAIDRATGEAWAVLPTTGQVARIAPNGGVIRLLGGLQSPWAIAVDTR